MEHRLVTVVFIDMQGYTKRSAGQSVEELKRFHDEFHSFVKTLVEQHGGILVKSLGDGFLVRFDSPTKAVQCSYEMQQQLMSRNEDILNPEKIVRFRIGINTGDVGIDESGDLFGDPVNIASRIQNFAEPNEVFISEATLLAMNRNEFGAKDLGPQQFKNATREIKVFKVLPKGVTADETKPEARSAAGPSAPRRLAPWQLAVAGGSALALLALAAYGLGRMGRPPAAPERRPDPLAAHGGVAGDRPAASRDAPPRPRRPGADAPQPPQPQRRPITDFDKDGDGRISKTEAPPMMQRNFARHDTNGDGFISADEQASLPGR
jgi:class 3 adenylate cyclase